MANPWASSCSTSISRAVSSSISASTSPSASITGLSTGCISVAAPVTNPSCKAATAAASSLSEASGGSSPQARKAMRVSSVPGWLSSVSSSTAGAGSALRSARRRSSMSRASGVATITSTPVGMPPNSASSAPSALTSTAACALNKARSPARSANEGASTSVCMRLSNLFSLVCRFVLSDPAGGELKCSSPARFV